MECGKRPLDKKTAQTIVNHRRGHGERRAHKPDHNLRIYQCNLCNYWHITHKERWGHRKDKFRP